MNLSSDKCSNKYHDDRTYNINYYKGHLLYMYMNFTEITEEEENQEEESLKQDDISSNPLELPYGQ